jgi:hypothetical protein
VTCFTTELFGQGPSETKRAAEGSSMPATRLVGQESLSKAADGKLSIDGRVLHFQPDNGAAAQISIGSIRRVFLGEQDSQEGGTPMALSRAAAPFGSGRVVALFSHKKYDIVTLEYIDANEGLNGVIFRVTKGQGQVFKDRLMANGAHTSDFEHQTAKTAPPKTTAPSGESGAVKASVDLNHVDTRWSVQVSTVEDGGVTNLEPAFNVAIYENLLEELSKTKRFRRVYRSGDRNASQSPDLLILETTVESYQPGSETRRAVTTVSGATKLKVRSQLCTRDGEVVLEKSVGGDVRLFGGNLRATLNLAHNVANSLRRATLPESVPSRTQ